MKRSERKRKVHQTPVFAPDRNQPRLERITQATGRMPLLFGAVILTYGVINVFFPDVFLLFGFYTSAGMAARTQVLWVLVALLFLALVARTKPEIRYPGTIVLAASFLLAVSFFVFRVRYPSLFADGEVGGLPTDMQLPTTLDKVGEQLRLPNVLCMMLFRNLPAAVNLDVPFEILYRNYEQNSAWLVVAYAFAVLLVALLAVVVLKYRFASGVERVWIWVLLACSCPMLNAYGFYDSYIHVVFLMGMFFVGAWMIAEDPASWKGYAFSLLVLPFSFFTHQYLWLTVPYLIGLGGLMFLRGRGVRVPFWLLVVCGVVAGCAPVISYALNSNLLTRVYSYHLGRYLLTQGMTCIMVSLPALILAIGMLFKDTRIVRSPSPIQGMAIVVLVANVVVFIFPILAPSPPTMIHNYGAYGAAIYGSAALLYFSSIRCLRDESGGGAVPVNHCAGAPEKDLTAVDQAGGSREGKVRLLACCAVFGAFTFVPTVYVHSNRLCYERTVRIVPDDITSWWSRDMSPYVCLGLWTPVDTERDRLARLDLFRQGFTSPRREWEEFRTLNMLYYIAWCFEFGKTEEGARELVKVFGQPGIVRDLWMNGTRFTDRYENKAYLRIRAVSRRIIAENLKRKPDNDYLRQMSQLLDQYEKYNP